MGSYFGKFFRQNMPSATDKSLASNTMLFLTTIWIIFIIKSNCVNPHLCLLWFFLTHFCVYIFVNSITCMRSSKRRFGIYYHNFSDTSHPSQYIYYLFSIGHNHFLCWQSFFFNDLKELLTVACHH